MFTSVAQSFVTTNEGESYNSVFIKEENSGTYNSPLSPWFVTGLFEDKGSFTMSISWRKNSSVVSSITPMLEFAIKPVHASICHALQLFFGVGTVFSRTNNKGVVTLVIFRVTGLNNIINFVIPHFNCYPLKGYRSGLFILWKEAALLLSSHSPVSQHPVVLDRILSIITALGRGLTGKAAMIYSHITPAPIDNTNSLPSIGTVLDEDAILDILPGQWIAGFLTLSCSFDFEISFSGVPMFEAYAWKAVPSFSISRSKQPIMWILSSLQRVNLNNRSAGRQDLTCYSMSSCLFIVDLLEQYPLWHTDSKTFTIWCKMLNIVENSTSLENDSTRLLKLWEDLRSAKV